MFNLIVIQGKVTELEKEDIWKKYPYLGEPSIGTEYTFTIKNKKIVFITNERFDIAEGRELKLWGYNSKSDLLCRLRKEESEIQVLAAVNQDNQITSLKFTNTKLLSFLLASMALIFLFLCYNKISLINTAFSHNQSIFDVSLLSLLPMAFYLFLFTYRPIMLIKTRMMFNKEIESPTHIWDI